MSENDIKQEVTELKKDMKENMSELKVEFKELVGMLNKNYSDSLDRFSKEVSTNHQTILNLTSIINAITSKHDTCSATQKLKTESLQKDIAAIESKNVEIASKFDTAIYKIIGISGTIILMLIGLISWIGDKVISKIIDVVVK